MGWGRRAREQFGERVALPGFDIRCDGCSYFPFDAASSWRIFAIVAAEGSLRFLFLARRFGFVE